MTFSIRRLVTDDLESYRSIRLEALETAPEAFGAAYEAAAAKPESYFRDILERLAVFGAFDDDGQQVGLVAFAQQEGAKYRHRGDMISMYVAPQMRGTGCAPALIETLLDHARHHVLQVHCGVGADNEPAIRLYRKAGFEIYGTEPRSLFVNGRYIDEHLMVRFLDRNQAALSQGTRKEDRR